MSANPQSHTRTQSYAKSIDQTKKQKKGREILNSIIIFIIGFLIICSSFTQFFVGIFYKAYEPLKIIIQNYSVYYQILKFFDPLLFQIYFFNLGFQIFARNKILAYVQSMDLFQFNWLKKNIVFALIIGLPQFVQVFIITQAMFYTLITPFNYACLINLFQFLSKESKKKNRRNKSGNIAKDNPEKQNKKSILDVLKESVKFLFTIKFMITFLILQILAIVIMAWIFQFQIKTAQEVYKLAKYVGSWFQ